MSGLDLFNRVWLALDVVGWSLVHSLWMGAGLWMGTWLCLRLMRRRAAWARYALACGALVLLAGLPLRSSVALYDSYSVIQTMAGGVIPRLRELAEG